MKRICKQCGKEFELSQSEILFYKKKNLSLPKRCKECREKNKNEKKQGRPAEKEALLSRQGSGVGSGKASRPVKSKWKSLAGIAAALLLLIFGAAAGWDRISSHPEPAKDGGAAKLEFRSEQLLEEHYKKHGIGMGFDSAQDYEAAAAKVALDGTALHKEEKEDGDDVYYLENTNELVIISTDGYIRTYFEPEDGIAYFERQ